MWTKACNGESQKPPKVSIDTSGVIVTRNHKLIAATEDMPEHWEYEEWQMTHDQYEVYQQMQTESDELTDALIELAEMIVGGE